MPNDEYILPLKIIILLLLRNLISKSYFITTVNVVDDVHLIFNYIIKLICIKILIKNQNFVPLKN